MKLLITGGAGFIGSNLIRYMLDRYPDYQLINLDALTYAGNPDNLAEVRNHPHYRFVRGDIADRELVDQIFREGVDAVIHLAAESHVDRSIRDPGVFVRTNVIGTQVLLEAARQYRVKRFVQVSTDEVYGSLGPDGLFKEETPLQPNSPYSASKAAGDLMARAYYETYGLPVMITRCSNNYGPYQFPEKLIPLAITRALADQPVPVYGDGLNIRDWLHVQDHCAGIDLVLHQGRPGEVYNIGGRNERTNIEVVKRVLAELGKPESLVEYVDDRLGHDRRYGIDATKIRQQLGWQPKIGWDEGIRQTVQWYLDNRNWWERIQSGAYRVHEEADRTGLGGKEI